MILQVVYYVGQIIKQQELADVLKCGNIMTTAVEVNITMTRSCKFPDHYCF